MGSSSSTPIDIPSRSDDPSSKSDVGGRDGNQQRVGPGASNTSIDTNDKIQPTAAAAAAAEAATNGLTGMALVNHRCRKPERRYRRCVSDYYSREFVTGRSMEQDCQDKFDAYRECVLRGIKSEIWDKQGLPPPKEGSPLAELDDN
jgi:Uncharacterised protein family (UPF0203)